MQMGKQTDLILLDFSKAFDKVAHEKLISKFIFYGMRDKTLSWVKEFSRAVVLNVLNQAKQQDHLVSRRAQSLDPYTSLPI